MIGESANVGGAGGCAEGSAGRLGSRRCIALRFSRSESRQRVLRTCKDCWGRWSARMDGSWPNTLETPRPMECSGCWRCTTDADQVRDDLQGYVMERLGDPGGVLVVDETGFLKQGRGGGKATVHRFGGEGGDLS